MSLSEEFLDALQADYKNDKHVKTAGGKQKTPQRVRGEIQRFLAEQKAQNGLTQTQWLKDIGINSATYTRFMGHYKDPWSAVSNGCYDRCAWEIYSHKRKEKELARLAKLAERAAAREAKKSAAAAAKSSAAASAASTALPAPPRGKKRSADDADFGDLTGPVVQQQQDQQKQEEEPAAPPAKKAKPMSKKERTAELLAKVRAVDVPLNGPVYDDCDFVRRKANQFLSSNDIVKGDWLAYLGLNSNSYRAFMNFKGKGAGGANKSYPALYRFFEQLRIADKKPKSKKRVEIEGKWGGQGYRLSHDNGQRWVLAGTNPDASYFDIDHESAETRSFLNHYGKESARG